VKQAAPLFAFALTMASFQGSDFEARAEDPDVAGKKTMPEVVCALAPSQSAIVNRVSGAAGGASATAFALGEATGLTVVAHSSGAAVLTGPGGYLAGSLGAGALAGPIIIGVGLVVGGAAVTVELLCAPKNHPEEVAKINKASVEFLHRSKLMIQNATAATTTAAKNTSLKLKSVAGNVYAYAYSKLPAPAAKERE